MTITDDNYSISRVSKDSIKSFTLNGKEYPLMLTGHSVIIDGVSPNSFVKRLKYNRNVEEIKARWKR